MSKEILNISIPVSINSSHTRKEIEVICSKAIKENENELYPWLSNIIDNGDWQLTVLDESLQVDGISIDDDKTGGYINLSFKSDYFSPCKDMRSIDDQDAGHEFDIVNGAMEFEIELQPAWRPDEYDM